MPPVRSHLLKKQMPGLDILRGVAVLAVLFFHGLGWSLPAHLSLSPGASRIGAIVQSGWLGVNLFFILSGFLITGILLDTRERHNYWKSFYVRRVLRILPLYLVVLILAKFQRDLQFGYILLCVFYAANMAVYFRDIGPVYGPLWSLAVEEQFYLIWPLLVRRIPARALAVVCLVLIVISPVLRGLSVHTFPWLGDAYSATWLISDNLAWGALIALFLRSPLASAKNVKTLTLGLWLGGVLLFGVLAKFHLFTRKTPLGASLQVVPFLALFTALLLLALRYGDNRHVIRWSAPIRFFGYISYGLYLLHLIFFKAYDDLLVRYVAPPDILTVSALLVRFLVVITLGSLICVLSRRFFEEKFLLLKERLVPYEKHRHAAPR